MADRRDTTISNYDTSSSFNPNVLASIHHRPSYQPTYDKTSEPKELSGSKACDPITILDDDETDAAEILHIDLENDNEVPAKGNYTARTNQAVAATRGSGSTSVAQNPSSYNDIVGTNHAKQSERVTYPLFRTLTKQDMQAQAPSVRSESKTTSGIGFKAWYEARDSDRTGNNVSGMRQKATSRIPPITVNNEKHPNNTARKDRDAPQFQMSVLSSKRKRTMGELGYDELISPAQIESPSEKLARMARKRQQRQEGCDSLLRNTNAGDTQSATGFDNRCGRENDEMTRDNAEMPLYPIVRTSHDGHARLSDERSGPSVARQPSPVGSYPLTEGHSDHIASQLLDDHSDGHMDAAEMLSNQISIQGHGDSIRDVPRAGRPRISGPTKVCGVFSPETKPPVKRSHRGQFHCPRCDSQFTTRNRVNYHFEGCVAKYGNPKSLKWSDHRSLERVAKRAGRASKDPRTTKTGTQVSAALKESTQGDVPIVRQIALDSVPIDTQIRIAAPIAPMRAPILGSDTQGADPLTLSAHQPANMNCTTPKLDPPVPLSEHRATAGKGLSHETLQRYQETGSWDRKMIADQDEDEAEEEKEEEKEETETPDIAYHYYVQKSEWLETEEDAAELSMGPFHTLNEANAVAKAEVQALQMDDYEGIHSTGWSYYYEQDENGLQKHMATVMEVHIETAVHRELAPAKQRVSIPKSAFIVAPRVYIVHELQWLPPSSNATVTAPIHCQSLLHGVFTLQNMANQRASAEYLDTLTGNWVDSEYDLLKKAEMQSDLDKKVRALKQENECFREETKLENGGFVRVWVEEMVVEGPRN